MLRPEALPTYHLREYMATGRLKPTLSIPKEELVLQLMRKFYSSRVNEALKGHFWISQDIATARDVVIPARGKVETPIILPSDLGPFNTFVKDPTNPNADPYSLSCAYYTTRSRFAQLGLEISDNAAVMIGETAWPVREDLILARTIIHNLANRDIYMPAQTPFSYAYFWNRQRLTGDELDQAIKTRMGIEGKEGEDWRKWYDPKSGILAGVEFMIDPSTRRYVPKSDDPTPMQIYAGPSKLHNRDEVDKYLSGEIPESDQQTLVISQIKAKLYLPETLHGICNMAVAGNGRIIGTEDSYDFQTNSVILRGGNTNSHIRAEHFCRTTHKNLPQTLLVHFANA